MSSIQKVIKYLAIAFAAFLTVSIISGIMLGISALSGVIGLNKKDNNMNLYLENIETISNIEDSNVLSLRIDVEFSNLKIIKGATFKAETNSKDITCTQTNNNLIIKEKSKWFLSKNASELIITIPENLVFSDIKISTGAGEVYIEDLKGENLNFEMGAGQVQIQNLNISNKAKIDGGAGKLEILSGEINNLNLNMGVGKCKISSKLTGSNDIDAGMGKLEIKLLDEIENYELKVNKGIGIIRINGKEVSDGTLYGNGTVKIKIDGGIGSIDINGI